METNYKAEKVYTVCYNQLDVFETKEEVKEYYTEGFYMSEGAEQNRYASILVDLNFSNLGQDKESIDCRSISIKMKDRECEFLKIDLATNLSISETIKFYEEKIQPLLKISEEYGIVFTRKMPFEDFGSDDESDYRCSFSNYYKELFEEFGLKVENISTEEISDGKYNLLVNNLEFDIRAWDKIESVLDNINNGLTISKSSSLEV